ncbi:MAG: polynucleotide adenylyltransferase, partial [Acidobacteria bacterium]|nr:polynucleotide adenylyltransferase [Acidobacteriota bacterium]
ARLLRHVGPAFPEDPLRVLRGMQLAGCFDLAAAPATLELCRGIKERRAEISGERVREEWLKWAADSREPSAGLRFLRETGWIEHVPELQALIGVPQDPEWHPEGDVFVHTGACCDALAGLADWRASDRGARIVTMLAVLCHDFGKPAATHVSERRGRQRIVSPGHEDTGGPLAVRFLERIGAPGWVVQRVPPLVTNHLAHLQASSDRAVRRLAKRLEPETIRNLVLVITADQFGRPPLPRELPPGLAELVARAAALELQDAAPRPVLRGRDLVGRGMPPGPALGAVLAAAFDAQLEGEFADLEGALDWLRRSPPPELPAEVRARL